MINDSITKTNDNFSHQIAEHEKGHDIWTYDVLKPGSGLGQAYNMAVSCFVQLTNFNVVWD